MGSWIEDGGSEFADGVQPFLTSTASEPIDNPG